MADTGLLRFVCNPYTNLRTSATTDISELCCAPPWCAPPGHSANYLYHTVTTEIGNGAQCKVYITLH